MTGPRRQQATGNRQQATVPPVAAIMDRHNPSESAAVTLEAVAYGKLNLTLDVLGKRADGYHDLEMVMISVSLADRLSIRLGTGLPWTVTCDRGSIPQGEGNLCWKAARRYCDAAGLDPKGLSIQIQKNIPAQGGMAGGSSDAAAVLRALNGHYKLLPEQKLMELALEVGSDVPYCLFGGAALARGRGELLTRLRPLPEGLWFVLARPDFSVSTPELFREIDALRHCEPVTDVTGVAIRSPAQVRPDTAAMESAILRGDLEAMGKALANAFEPLVAARYPVVKELKSIMLTQGALGACLTGTGSVVFGLYNSKFKAAASALTLKDLCAEVHIATSVPRP